MEIKCKILKKGFIEQENYTTFTTTLEKSLQIIKIIDENEIHPKSFYHTGKPIIINIDCSDYNLNNSELIINNILVSGIHNEDFINLINLYNNTEGLVKEKLGQLGVTFIVNLVPTNKEKTEIFDLDNSPAQGNANSFEEDF